MIGLLIPTFILAILVFIAGGRSGRPATLAVLHFVLASAATVGSFFLGVSGYDFVGDLTDSWAPPQQGDAFGFGRMGAYFITAILVGNLISLPIILILGLRMASRRGPTWNKFEHLVRKARAVCGRDLSISDVGFDENALNRYLRKVKPDLALDEVASISGDNPVPPEFWALLLEAAKLQGLQAHARRYENKLSLASGSPSV